MKLPNIKKQHLYVLVIILLIGITFSVIQIINAAKPNPGHSIDEIEGLSALKGTLNCVNVSTRGTSYITHIVLASCETGYIATGCSATGYTSLSGWSNDITGCYCTFAAPQTMGSAYCVATCCKIE